MAKVENPRQITKYQTGKALVEYNDKLSVAPVEQVSHLHSTYSKIQVVAIDYEKGKGSQAVVADLNVDPDTAKTLITLVLSFTKTSENPVDLLKERKILSHKQNDDGECKVTTFSVGYNPKMNLSWSISVENGIGMPEVNAATGGKAIKRGSYRKEY